MRPYYDREGVTLHHGKAEDVLRTLPDKSVHLIATDPPYFRVKGEWWDRQWDDADRFLAWLGGIAAEWRRVLAPNGSLYVFASPQMARRVETLLAERFTVLNSIRWIKEDGWHQKAEKEALRSYLTPWEAVIFAEPFEAEWAYRRKCDDARGATFESIRAYLDGERRRAGVDFEGVRRIVGCAPGSGLPSHWFTQSQWALPSAAQYAKLQAGFSAVAGVPCLTRPYRDLRAEYEAVLSNAPANAEHAALRRPFHLHDRAQWSDIWQFDPVQSYPGKHPCAKPLPLMSHIVAASSRPGDVVLDCFAGHGSTLRAAKYLGRQAIGVEVEEKNCRYAVSALGQGALALFDEEAA
jgi:site-specific DNA-methyltransferase (adenine-specific)